MPTCVLYDFRQTLQTLQASKPCLQDLWRLRLDVCAAAAAPSVPPAAGIACLLRRGPHSFPDCDLAGTVTAILEVRSCCVRTAVFTGLLQNRIIQLS